MGKALNRFDQLVEDLLSGDITLTMICIAIKTYVRRSENTQNESISILCGSDGSTSLIDQVFKILSQTIGGFELAIRRAKDSSE